MKHCSVTILTLLLLSAGFHESNAKDADEESWGWWGLKTAVKSAVAVGTGMVAIAAAPVVLGAAGFTAAGVATGSLAATVQAGIGGAVASGSAFAGLQSAGAAGVGLATKAVIAATGAAAGYKAADEVEKKLKST